VLGRQRKFLSAVIVPNWDKIQEFAHSRNLPSLDPASDEIHPEIASWLAAEIAGASSQLADHERIKRFCLLPEAALLDPEIITPTQKLRRNSFEACYRASIDRMYSDNVPFVITGRDTSVLSAEKEKLQEVTNKYQ
jgi:long-chain acyl-CoA synthetase